MVAARPRLVTLAPEMPGAGDAIKELVEAGVVVSAGHSTASYDTARAGVRSGIRFATHLFNAMGAWGHREPGLPGAVLTDHDVTAGLISDGVHVHLAAVEAAIRLKGADRVALTTDMVAAAGSPPGRYRLGDREVISDGRRVLLVEDGTLAGGAGTMDELVRICAGLPGVGLRWAVEMATLTPARAVGEDRMGRIEPGLPADLVLLDPDLRVRLTLVGGEVAYE
jgi:N-acetylglucosamine-6-phosphate deacetylase